MTLMHRYLLRQFLVAYLACFVSLFLIYLVLDVFTKMDEFAVDPHRRQTQAARTTAPDADPLLVETKTERAAARASLPTFFQNMVNYYWYRAPLFFDRVNAFIALLGATFSLGWLQRQNEFLPLFAAGVSLRRLLLPLWILLALIVALGAAGREWVIPACAPFLLREAEDPLGRRPLLVQGCFDEHDIHVEGRVAYPDRKMIQHARLTLPATPDNELIIIQCKEMFYRPANERDASGWWLMGCTPAELPRLHPALHVLAEGEYFLTTELSYDRLTRRPNWHAYQSTARLVQLLDEEENCPRRTDIIALVHRRFTTPFLELTLILLSLPLIVGHTDRHLLLKVGGVMAIFGGTTLLDLLCGSLARADYLDPVLAGWLPLMLLGPWALVQTDALPT